MSVHITVEKQTESYTTKSVEDATVEGYDAAYAPKAGAAPFSQELETHLTSPSPA